ncbi:MAG TPA: hypothetical protein VFG91_07675 [Woeseiaceae bacterium]|nr:hypothetical protein [Woeseiaceae bacterium]
MFVDMNRNGMWHFRETRPRRGVTSVCSGGNARERLVACGSLAWLLFAVVPAALAAPPELPDKPSAQDEVLALLAEEKPYTVVAPDLFAQLGWELPDGGETAKALADEAPGGAMDPHRLEAIPPGTSGYRATWHEVRFEVYGVDWDITGLRLLPDDPIPGLPGIVIVNGGAANWYEFFFDPLNRPGLGQYLAQKVPVLLVSIPGNYRPGGWSQEDFGERIPAYVLDRDISPEEAAIRNAAFTFRVVTDGIAALVRSVMDEPYVIVGHSTGGEVQFILKDSPLGPAMRGWSLGWGTGGPAGMQAMRAFRGARTADDYQHVARLRARTPDQYARGYLGPLNPFWDPGKSRLEMAEEWIAAVQHRRPQFKQPLQDIEHNSAVNLRTTIESQIRETLAGNSLGIDADEVCRDLFTTMRSPLSGYRKMIWTTASLDSGHWNPDPANARELRVANEFRAANPGIPVRVLLFDVPMTHYGHIEKPRELAGGLLAALRWLSQPE